MRALLLALALLGLCAAPAAADTWHGSDPAGDVALFTHTPDPAPCGTSTDTPVPSDTRRDVTRLAVDHRAETVELRLAMGRVSARDTETTYGFSVSTPGRDYLVDLDRRHPGRALTPSLVTKPRRLHPDQCGISYFAAGASSCPGLTAHADVRHDRVEVSLPRSCVGDPRWVQVTALAYEYGGSTDTVQSSLQDVWGLAGSTQAAELPGSPRVRRG